MGQMQVTPDMLRNQVIRELAVLVPRRDAAKAMVVELETALTTVAGFKAPNMLEVFDKLAVGIKALLSIQLINSRQAAEEAQKAIDMYQEQLDLLNKQHPSGGGLVTPVTSLPSAKFNPGRRQ